MTSEEMANDEIKKQREAFVKEGINESQLAVVQVRQFYFCTGMMGTFDYQLHGTQSFLTKLSYTWIEKTLDTFIGI